VDWRAALLAQRKGARRMTSPSIEGKLWRSNYQGVKLQEITTGMLEASVLMDTDNDQTYQLDAIMHYDAWKQLTPYIDWIIPELIVRWPDGTVRQGPLGLYLLIDPATTRGENRAYVHLRAMDPLWLLARQGFTTAEMPTARKVLTGVNRSGFVRTLLNTMVVSETVGERVRYAVPWTAHTFVDAYEWDETENKLDVANEVLEGMGCWPLWASKTGVLTTREYGLAQYQHPVRTYSANIPEGFTIADRIKPIAGMASEVAGIIDTAAGFEHLLNTVLVVNDYSTLGGIYTEVEEELENDDRDDEDDDRDRGGDGKKKKKKRRRRAKRRKKAKHNKHVTDAPTATRVATGILDKLNTFNETIRLDVVPDPEPEFAREAIDLLIWDTAERGIARSKYLVHRVTYRFTPLHGTMTIECGRIDMAEGGLIATAIS
jgi:hypothetical protein